MPSFNKGSWIIDECGPLTTISRSEEVRIEEDMVKETASPTIIDNNQGILSTPLPTNSLIHWTGFVLPTLHLLSILNLNEQTWTPELLGEINNEVGWWRIVIFLYKVGECFYHLTLVYSQVEDVIYRHLPGQEDLLKMRFRVLKEPVGVSKKEKDGDFKKRTSLIQKGRDVSKRPTLCSCLSPLHST